MLGNERVPAADRLLNQVDERRHPRTSATVDQLLDLHFELATLEPTTRSTYIGYANKQIRPLIGGVKAGVLDADVFDSFYAELRRWREHCDRRPFTQHRTTVEHTCDDRCRPHVCTPLGASTINSVSVARLGINSTFHKLRHYSATELISAGVDARTVAGNGLDPLEQPAKIGSKTTAIAHVLNHRVSPRAAPRARRQPSSSCVVGYQRKR